MAVATLMVASVVVATHIERYESSYVFVTRHTVYDFIGTAKEQWNSLVRRCDAVVAESGTSEHSKEIERYLNSGVVHGSGRTAVLTTTAQQDWYLVEVEFESLEPALLVLHYEQGKYVWFEDATWSGNPGPWVAGPFIREFIGSKAPSIPRQLLQCFKPSLSHFVALVGPLKKLLLSS